MGAISEAMASAGREPSACRSAPAPASPRSRSGTAGLAASCWRTGPRLAARVVLSNADPKRTFLGLVDKGDLPDDFRRAVAGDQDGRPVRQGQPGACEEPRVLGMPADADAAAAPLFTLAPDARSSRGLLRRGQARRDRRDELWVDCVVASNVDPTRSPRQAATS